MPEESLLLLTKLRLPTNRAQWVPRERLFERLDGLREARVVLVSAPPGYGKTTLLASWLSRAANLDPTVRPAWYSLDAGDNDPIRFWSYLVGAVQHALHPVLGEALPGREFLELVRSPQPPPFENALVSLLNEISGLAQPVWLVLDDYHLIENEVIHAGLRFLIENQPENLRLVVASRSEPPFAHTRYRVRGWLLNLNAADLRFRGPEAEAFLLGSMRLSLNGEEVRALEDRTEGWAAGLQMAALALQSAHGTSPAERQAVIQGFSGDDRYLLDYLTEEVLSRLPEHMQNFLLHTSVLERFNVELCAALVDRPALEVQSLLVELDRANLFVFPLDSRRGWYRYHALFAGALRDRLERVQPELVPVLHQQAATWLMAHELLEEAIGHALEIDDWQTAAKIVQRMAMAWVEKGENQTLRTWLDRFPRDLVRQQPALCLGYGWTALYGANFSEAAEWASAAEQALQPGERIAFQAQIDLLRATVAINHKNFERAIQLSRRALPFLPEEQHMLRAVVFLNLGDAYHFRCDFEAAAEAFQQGYEAAHAGGSRMLEVVIIGSLGDLYLHQGRLSQAERTLQAALLVDKDTTGGEGVEMLAVGKPLSFLSYVYLERNELERALATVLRAVDLCERWGHPEHSFDSCMRLAEICLARGDQAGMRQAVERARAWLERIESANLPVETKQEMINSYRWRLGQTEAVLACQREDVDDVRGWLSQQGLLAQSQPERRGYRSASLLVWYLMVTGELEKALGLLQALQAQELGQSTAANPWLFVDLQVKFALLYQQMGQPDKALACMESAVIAAEPESILRRFVLRGEPVRVLLEKLARSGSKASPVFMERLLAEFPKKASNESRWERPVPVEKQASPSSITGIDLETESGAVEPLSEREMEILRLLAAGQTYPEMAAALYLSLNTIKTHVKRIYAKLGASSRLSAVNTARKLGFLH